MSGISTEIFIILALIAVNGLFSLSEMAIVSAKKSRLQQRAEDGDAGAVSALALAENPNRFLSTVQVGITLIGILSGAFGGATIAEKISASLTQVPVLAPYSDSLSVGIVVVIITFLSIVIGELVPKRIALNNAEKIAVVVSPLMSGISFIATPLVALFSATTNLVLRLMGIQPSTEPDVTEDDLKSMLEEGTLAGVFEESEHDMVERIFRLGDRSVSMLMTPRTEIVFIDVDDSFEEIAETISTYSFSRFPVISETSDNVIGIIRARDFLLQQGYPAFGDLRSILLQPIFVPESAMSLTVLERFKSTGIEMAIVVDEYGGVLGLVTLTDVLEAIVGDVATPHGVIDSEAVQREDGSWLFDGLIQVDELKEYLDVKELPDEGDRNYETLSGLIMSQLGRVPIVGDYFAWDRFKFEVVDMDGRRVDKVLVSLTDH
ncbi:MAG: hemolysin family protein [Anaerolineae bacterium]|nr:hemolysin family protein [Anaerolineae bacterium]